MCSLFYRLISTRVGFTSCTPSFDQTLLLFLRFRSIVEDRYSVQKLFLFPWHILHAHTGRITISLSNFVTQVLTEVTKVNKRFTHIKQHIFLEQRKCSPSTKLRNPIIIFERAGTNSTEVVYGRSLIFCSKGRVLKIVIFLIGYI